MNDMSNIYLGCMCYKMYNINIQPVYKSDIVDDVLLNKVKHVIDTIKECKTLNCIDSQKKIIDMKYK